MTRSLIDLASVSWIDEKSVPKVGFWDVAGALVSWQNRVVMGLVGTSNPEPPAKLEVASFTAGRQYRALLACSVDPEAPAKVSKAVIDPGYTPPFNKSKLDTVLRSVAPIPEDQKFYPGERSAVSAVMTGRLHGASSLTVPKDHRVVASALIKFRAGPHTDQIGIDDAKSPVHVPWVWCEFALIAGKAGYRLLGSGSTFPSHAWYVNGEQVAKRLQCQVSASKHDATLSTGQPADRLQEKASVDKSTGPAGKHQYAIGAGAPIDVPLPDLGK